MIYCNKPMPGNGYCGDRDDDPETNVYSQTLCPECEARNAMKKEQEEVYDARELAEVL